MFKAIEKISQAMRASAAKNAIDPAIFNDPLSPKTILAEIPSAS